MLNLALTASVHKYRVADTVVWLLNQDARMTGSAIATRYPGRRVCKLLFRSASAADEGDDDIERLALEADVQDRVLACIRGNHVELGCETVGPWSASFLPRYEEQGDTVDGTLRKD